MNRTLIDGSELPAETGHPDNEGIGRHCSGLILIKEWIIGFEELFGLGVFGFFKLRLKTFSSGRNCF